MMNILAIFKDEIKKLIERLIVLIFFAGSRAGEKWKRHKEQKQQTISELRPSSIHNEEMIVVSMPSSAVMERIASLIGKLNGRISLQSNTEIIAFIGDAGDSKFDGMLFTPDHEMPFRVAVRTQTFNGETKVTIMLDEDYGFQLFVGPAKRAFREKYENAFRYFLDEVKDHVKS